MFNFYQVGVKSEVSLYHEDDLLWFVNANETQHRFHSTLKGSLQSQRYHNPTFNHSGDCAIKNDRHTTGVYASSPLEILPPFYIFDTKSKQESNYQIDPKWCCGLP